jgi:predicted Zn-dependent protease
MKARRWGFWAVFAAASLALAGCAGLPDQLGSIKLSSSDQQALVKTGKALRSGFQDLTEEEEYYIGRAVSALILSRYKVLKNSALTAYVNQVGQAAAVYSDRPETYAGYHFQVLDTDEVNALAAPGGFIFITKGLLLRCRNEEMLGCILAHEVGHVAAKHGLSSIKKSRLVDAFKIMGQHLSEKYTPEQLTQLTQVFENALADITESLVERGYDRKYEYEADKLGVEFSARTGWDPNGMADFLQTMVDDTGGESAGGWFKTHPSAADRLKRVNKQISGISALPETAQARTSRFQSATRGLK